MLYYSELSTSRLNSSELDMANGRGKQHLKSCASLYVSVSTGTSYRTEAVGHHAGIFPDLFKCQDCHPLLVAPEASGIKGFGVCQHPVLDTLLMLPLWETADRKP